MKRGGRYPDHFLSLSEPTLLARASNLAGRTLGEVTRSLGRPLSHATKGIAGETIERALGVRQSRKGVDVPSLGIEIKTIPLRADGRPAESTFVCAAPLASFEEEWESSPAQAKLARVLFVPIECASTTPLAARRIGAAWLWSPTREEDDVLRRDWETLRDVVLAHGIDALHARLGRALQVRPKAATGASRARTRDADGVPASALPRGCYLRASFTRTLVPRALR